MPTYMKAPIKQVTITHSGTDYTFTDVATVNVTRRENAFDIATIRLTDYQGDKYSAKVSGGDAVQIDVKDRSDASWTTVLTGITKVCLPDLPPDMLTVKCDGAGYGLGMTSCAKDYGTQSENPTLDTLKEIGEDIVDNYVNKILGSATSSGYSYTKEIEDIAGTMRYFYFPYKPCDKGLNDVCDVLQAIKGASAGPHWIVTTASKLIVSTVGSHHAAAVSAGWTNYYGGSQLDATLEQGKDFTNFRFQELDEEANYVVYYGTLKKPATEIWTENNSSLWGYTAGGSGHGIYDDGVYSRVGSYSLKCVTDDSSPSAAIYVYYPSAKNAAWDMEKWGGRYSFPKINFYLRRHADIDNFLLELCNDGTNYFSYDLGGSLGTALKWYWFSLPIGPYALEHTMGDEVQMLEWGSGDWSAIDYVQFVFGSSTDNKDAWIDDLFFSGKVVRVASNSNRYPPTLATGHVKMKTITDDVGKDDSGKAADDSGTIARLAYVELLRSQTTPIVGTFTIRMLKDLLPGQLLHVHAKKTSSGSFRIDKDMRVTKLIHSISEAGFYTQVYVTDDVINSHARSPYNELNKLLGDVRPEFQDRQATSIKMRDIDITIPRLEKDYPS